MFCADKFWLRFLVIVTKYLRVANYEFVPDIEVYAYKVASELNTTSYASYNNHTCLFTKFLDVCFRLSNKTDVASKHDFSILVGCSDTKTTTIEHDLMVRLYKNLNDLGLLIEVESFDYKSYNCWCLGISERTYKGLLNNGIFDRRALDGITIETIRGFSKFGASCETDLLSALESYSRYKADEVNLNSSLSVLSLPTRYRNILYRNGIFTVNDLVTHSADDLLKYNGISSCGITAITNALSKHALYLSSCDKNIEHASEIARKCGFDIDGLKCLTVNQFLELSSISREQKIEFISCLCDL